MSHLFDALQRSEKERAEPGTIAPSEPIELLRVAERRVASKWDATALVEQPTIAEDAERLTSFEIEKEQPAARVKEAPTTSELSPAVGNVDVFGLFQTLQVSPTPQNRLVCLTDSDSPAAEAFRLLGVRLRHLRQQRPLKNVLITSSIPQEGKSMVSANLACTLALRTQQKVLLVEGDLRRPTFSQMFGIGKHPGLCECLQGEHTLVTSIYRLDGAGFWLLPAGSDPSNALELLQSGRLSPLMSQLAEWFEWIIIDSPPVLPLGDTSVWMRSADGVLLVTRQETTGKRGLKRAIEAIESRKLIGAVSNCSTNSNDSDYYYRRPRVTRANVSSTK